MKTIRENQLKIRSVQYVYDKTGASKWFDVYVDLVKEAMIKSTSHTLSHRKQKELKEGEHP